LLDGTNKIKISDMEKLRVHDINCEMYVIGVLLTYNNAYNESTDILRKEVFWKPEHQELYNVVKSLYDEGETVDIIKVAAYINQHPNKNCQLELSYLTECASSVVSSVNFREHCLRLHDLYERRQLWLIGQKLINAGTSEIIDTVTLKQDVISAIQSLDDTPHASIVSVSDALKQLNEIVNNNMSGEQSRGIPTGFSYLDDRGGLCRGDLVVIAAEFSQGKTSLALDLSTSAARNNYPVAFYSTEMTNPQLSARIISAGSDGKIRANDIIHKALTQEQLNVFDKAVGRIESLPIFFDDTSTMSIERIISSIRMLVRKKGICLACIDFLQVLQTNEKNMRQNE
jgi:replicative DNA helicase